MKNISKSLMVVGILFMAPDAFAGTYSVKHCLTISHSIFVDDKCSVRAGSGDCAASMDDDHVGSAVAISIGGKTYNGTIQTVPVYGSDDLFSLKMGGGLVGGSVHRHMGAITEVDVTVNDDASGSSYTQYTCHMHARAPHAARQKKASVEPREALEPAVEEAAGEGASAI